MAAREVMDRYAATARGGDGELWGRAAVIGYIDAARAKSHGAEVEVEVVDTLASEERVMLLFRERFADGDEVVEIERANVYTVRDGAIAEVWIFEADQYAVDELMGEA